MSEDDRIAARNVSPYAFGSGIWPGTGKLIEEMGELHQVLGKLLMIGGRTDHWSGDLRAKLVEELGDVSAAILIFADLNLTEEEQEQVNQRGEEKYKTFAGWHEEGLAAEGAVETRVAIDFVGYSSDSADADVMDLWPPFADES